ncbi:DUF6702 family protein [Reichenbachiella sp. MALMAid0571]|uniref:DUF6702 family protein n=1 Tax=Reichenbachiella sp. MALMAid0571 TaxID=3143939 RepID=UPI0032DF14EE
MVNYIIPLFFYLSGALAHAFHISVCEIEYDEERKSLEITHRVFLDDLETTLKSWSGDQSIDVINPKVESDFQKILGKYMLEKFSVNVNGKETNLSFLGSEPDGDVMYCYIELTGVKKLNSLYIVNQIFMDKFDDQMNMVHIYKGEKTTSTKFSKNNTDFTIDFE